MKKTLRLILGDQLNYQHSWFKKKEKEVTYVIMELRQETDYVAHHIQKVVAFFEAMEAFAEYLTGKGHQVIYWKLDKKENGKSIVDNLNSLIKKHKFEHFEYQLPDEYLSLIHI